MPRNPYIDYELTDAGRVEVFNCVTTETLAVLPGWTLRIVAWWFR